MSSPETSTGAVKTASGLTFIITKHGAGAQAKVGDTVSEGSVIVVVEAEGGAAAPAAAPAAKHAPAEEPADAPATPSPAPAAPSALAQAPLIPAGEGGTRRPSHASPIGWP